MPLWQWKEVQEVLHEQIEWESASELRRQTASVFSQLLANLIGWELAFVDHSAKPPGSQDLAGACQIELDSTRRKEKMTLTGAQRHGEYDKMKLHLCVSAPL